MDLRLILGGGPLSPPGNAGSRKFAKYVETSRVARDSPVAPGLEVVLLQTGLGSNDPDSREKNCQRGLLYPPIGDSDQPQKPDRGVIF